MEPAYGMSIRELNLASSHVNTLSNKISAVPGLRTSAAFFVFLRANLVLDQNAISTCNTPYLQPFVDVSPTAPPSPSLTASSSSSATSQTESLLSLEDDIPPLSLDPLSSKAEKAQSIQLIADSISQMRWTAAKSLLLNPVCLAGVTTTLSTIHSLTRDPWMALTLSCAVMILSVQAVRFFTRGYSSQAENLTTKFFQHSKNSDDIVIGARYGNEVVATAVLHLELPSVVSSNRRKHNRVSSFHGGRGIIRAWTTRSDIRGIGVGRDLLLEAVKITKERCGKDAKVGFAKEHANSKMVLPSIFNRRFRKDEMKATKTLESVLEEWEVCKKRR